MFGVQWVNRGSWWILAELHCSFAAVAAFSLENGLGRRGMGYEEISVRKWAWDGRKGGEARGPASVVQAPAAGPHRAQLAAAAPIISVYKPSFCRVPL